MKQQTKKAEPSNGRKKRIIAIILLVAALVGIIAALIISNIDDYKQYKAERRTVAVCNGYDIPYEELRFVTMYYKDYLADTHGEKIWDDPATAEQYREELTRLVTNNLNQNYVILSACRQLGIDTDSDDLDKQIDQDIKELQDELKAEGIDYDDFLIENNMTDHYCRFTLEVNLLTSAIHETMLDQGLYRYSSKNVDDFMEYVETDDNYVRIIHIYIENREGDDPAENLAEAQRISDELQAIEDLDERLAHMREGIQTSHDYSDASGNGYYFTHGEMNELYEKAAFDLELGEVSDPVVCSGGNFILMRLEREEEYIAQNVTTLLNNYYGVELGRYIDQFRSLCEVAYTDYGKSIDLVAME